MNARLARVESHLEGLKRVQDITTIAMIGVGAILIAAMAYAMVRIEHVGERVERVNERVIELPGKVGAELRDLTKTLADTITATKQQVPQVILMPAPQLR